MSAPRAAAAAWLTAAGLAAAVAAAALFEVRAARAAAGAEREVRSEFSRELELDEAEWNRVRTRRAGLGAPLAALTPYEVLGLYAESPEQRRRYAAANRPLHAGLPPPRDGVRGTVPDGADPSGGGRRRPRSAGAEAMKPDPSGHSPYGTGSAGRPISWRPGRGRREARLMRHATREARRSPRFCWREDASGLSRYLIPPCRSPDRRCARNRGPPPPSPLRLSRRAIWCVRIRGERRILQQLLHELRLCRSLIDDAYAHRDDRARVRVDYGRLAADFNSMMAGLQQTLAATETAPREPGQIRGEYRLYE